MFGAFVSGVVLTVFAFFLYRKIKEKRDGGGGFSKDDSRANLR